MTLPALLAGLVETGNALFTTTVTIIAAAIATVAVIDRTQKKDPLRYKFPVVARFIPFFDRVIEITQQHAPGRSTMPFNQSQRHALERYGKGKGNIIGFGSDNNLRMAGTPIIIPSVFPVKNPTTSPSLVIGPYCEKPYTASSIFNISAMSYGALSERAVLALTAGAKQANCWLDTGEGGLAEEHLVNGCDIVFQIGTAKYGVRNEDGSFSPEKLKEIAAHDSVKMIEIKLSQGAKPGKGGILPGVKVTEKIAKIRGIPVGKDSISPPGHVEIFNVPSLLDDIHYKRSIAGKPTGIKIALSDFEMIEELCEEVKRRGIESAPDFITLDGGEGGSGAAPMALMDSAGLSIRESLPMVASILLKHGLKERIRLIAAGKLVEAARVAWALAAGADFVNSARGFMIGGLGCIQAKQCHNNTCPQGITTNNPELAERLDVEMRSEHTANLCEGIRNDVEMLAHTAGVAHARLLGPQHIAIVQPDTTSRRLIEIYPALK